MHVHLKATPAPAPHSFCPRCMRPTGMLITATVLVTHETDGEPEVEALQTQLGVACANCNNLGELSTQVTVPERRVKQPGPHQSLRRRADRQARDSAQETGAMVHKASGALPYLKSDIRKKGVFRCEQKFTQNQKAFVLKREYLDKIRAETTDRTEIPVLEVLFVEPRTLKAQETWAIIPWEDFKRLIA